MHCGNVFNIPYSFLQYKPTLFSVCAWVFKFLFSSHNPTILTPSTCTDQLFTYCGLFSGTGLHHHLSPLNCVRPHQLSNFIQMTNPPGRAWTIERNSSQQPAWFWIYVNKKTPQTSSQIYQIKRCLLSQKANKMVPPLPNCQYKCASSILERVLKIKAVSTTPSVIQIKTFY